MIDPSEIVRDIIRTDRDLNLAFYLPGVYDSRVEPTDLPVSIDVRLLTKREKSIGNYVFDVSAVVSVACEVRDIENYKTLAFKLGEHVKRAVIFSPVCFDTFGKIPDLSITYSFDSQGESNFGIAVLQFQLSYQEKNEQIEGSLFDAPLTRINAGIDIANPTPDQVIDEQIEKVFQ